MMSNLPPAGDTDSDHLSKITLKVWDGNTYMVRHDGWTHENLCAVNIALGNLALDKELPFTWYDAAVFSTRIRHLFEDNEERESSAT